MTITPQPGRAEVAAQSAPCCDDHGWKLDPRGQPVEPAARCSRHPRKSAATNRPADAATADAPDTRDGNKNKFAWFYEMLADPSVSLAAKVVGTGCCMKLAGRKGYFRATRKAIASLCGISQSTVRRGLADLIEKRFLDADIHEGAASTYFLILPADRLAQWLVAEEEFGREIVSAEREIERWLWAEKLHKQNEFRDAICEASIARGADQGHARRIAEGLVGRYRDEGIELDVERGLAAVARSNDEVFIPAAPPAETMPSGGPESDHERADPGTSESRPRYAREPTPVRLRADPGTPESRPRLTTDADTSGDDETHKSFKSFKDPERSLKDLESEPALREALARSLRPVRSGVGDCDLCDTDGRFLDADGELVFLAEFFDNDERFVQHPLDCQHSIAGNLAEIRRREKAEDVELFRTGWPEIDIHYPVFNDDKVATNPNP